MRSSGQGTILEAFKPGTAPPEATPAMRRRARSTPMRDADRGRLGDRRPVLDGTGQRRSQGPRQGRSSAILSGAQSRRTATFPTREPIMRAEAEALVEAIKQSVGLLRRHL